MFNIFSFLSELLSVQKIFDKKKSRSTRIDEQSMWTEERHLGYRSASIDTILFNYTEQQQERYKFKKHCKTFFVFFFVILLIGLIGCSIALCVFAIHNFENRQIEFLTCIITSVVNCFTSILSILLIIVKYLFPPNEETNFNNLVSIIVKNDTKRLQDISKKVNKESANNTTNEKQ